MQILPHLPLMKVPVTLLWFHSKEERKNKVKDASGGGGSSSVVTKSSNGTSVLRVSPAKHLRQGGKQRLLSLTDATDAQRLEAKNVFLL